MKTLLEVVRLSTEFLESKKTEQPRRDAEEIIAHALHCKRQDLYLQFDKPLEENELQKIRPLLNARASGVPLLYVLKKCQFFGVDLTLSNAVLIPRPETEILLSIVSDLLKNEDVSGKTLWDIGTGSGALGLGLKKRFPELSVTLSDISREALDIAKKNSLNNELDVSLLQSDLFSSFEGKKADYIISNPPYISAAAYEALDSSVKAYEPQGALLAGVRGTEFYERFAKEAPSYLNPGAKLFFEIGFDQKESLQKIFSSPMWKKKQILQDYAGHDRFFFLEIE